MAPRAVWTRTLECRGRGRGGDYGLGGRDGGGMGRGNGGTGRGTGGRGNGGGGTGSAEAEASLGAGDGVFCGGCGDSRHSSRVEAMRPSARMGAGNAGLDGGRGRWSASSRCWRAVTLWGGVGGEAVVSGREAVISESAARDCPRAQWAPCRATCKGRKGAGRDSSGACVAGPSGAASLSSLSPGAPRRASGRWGPSQWV